MVLNEDFEKEVEILSKYLPEEMTEEQIIKVIDETFEELKPTSMKDMGNIMKEITPKLKGKTDMGNVSKIVKDMIT